jgi:hypothetical protein
MAETSSEESSPERVPPHLEFTLAGGANPGSGTGQRPVEPVLRLDQVRASLAFPSSDLVSSSTVVP